MPSKEEEEDTQLSQDPFAKVYPEYVVKPKKFFEAGWIEQRPSKNLIRVLLIIIIVLLCGLFAYFLLDIIAWITSFKSMTILKRAS